MISGQVCQAGRLHPTVQSKQVHLPPSHWTKWASPGLPKTTGGCLIAISLVALFFPMALANPLNPTVSTDMKLPDDECSKTNSRMSQNDIDEFVHGYPRKNLVQIKTVKTQKTLYVDPRSKNVFFDSKPCPENYSEYFQISRHPSKSGHLVKNVFSCLYLCVTRQGKIYTNFSINDDECRFDQNYTNHNASSVADRRPLASTTFSNSTHTLLLDGTKRKVRAHYVKVGQEGDGNSMIFFFAEKNDGIEMGPLQYNYDQYCCAITARTTLTTKQRMRARRRKRKKCRQSLKKSNPYWGEEKVKRRCHKQIWMSKCKKRRRKQSKRKSRKRLQRKRCLKKYKIWLKKRRCKVQSK